MSQIIKPQIIGIKQTAERMQVAWGQTVGRILNGNETLRKNSDENWKRDDDIKLVGRVPRTTWMLWQSMGITEDEIELAKALERNPEFKTTEKRLL